MTTPVLPPTIDDTFQGEVDKEKSQSSHSDAELNISIPKDFGFIPVLPHLRYDDTKPLHFGLLLNLGFGFISIFSECFN